MSERDPGDYQPPPTWWGQGWRVLAAVGISAVTWSRLATWQWQHDRAWFAIDLALGVVSLVLMHYRRRWPVQIVLVTTLAGLVSASSVGPAVVALASLATRRRWREIVPLTLVVVLQSLVFAAYNPASTDPFLLNAAVAVLATGVNVAVGMYIGSRRELVATLRERAHTAESEQALRVARARTAERGRIAREMHDVLAHRISLVSMHAGALTYRTDLSADEVRRTTEVISANANQALADLRDVLGVLRDEPAAEAPSRPQPTWADIPDLVEQARSGQSQVTYANTIDDEVLPARVGRAVYRIVQEALTNARKHAPDAAVHVDVHGRRDSEIVVEVRNPLRLGSAATPAPPSGLGLVGLSERAALSGGTLTHEITADHEFVLRARLPWGP